MENTCYQLEKYGCTRKGTSPPVIKNVSTQSGKS